MYSRRGMKVKENISGGWEIVARRWLLNSKNKTKIEVQNPMKTLSSVQNISEFEHKHKSVSHSRLLTEELTKECCPRCHER